MKESEQRVCWLLQLGLECGWDSAAQSTVVNGADTQQMAASTDSERKNKIKNNSVLILITFEIENQTFQQQWQNTRHGECHVL